MPSRHSTRQIPRSTLIFRRYFVYTFRSASGSRPFDYVLCLSSTETDFLYPVKNLTFLPIIKADARSDRDPYRVPLMARGQGGTTKLPGRMYVVVDGIQSIGVAAFSENDLGAVTDAEAREVKAKLEKWLGL